MDEIARDESAPEHVGPFRVVRRLGAGGMAEAFEAVREGPGGFEQRVCIKRVLPGYSTDEDFVRLFLREARLAAALSHRNVTRVLDFGQHLGCYYLALELVDGIDVRRLLRSMGRPLPVEAAALIAMEVAEALDHAHTRGGKTGAVIHRDVSPANILVSADGDVKLTDFGISKALNDAAHTRSELVRGNLWYMAPEQMDGTSRADPRSDIFSLGVVLYECLAGRRPYDGPTDLAAIKALSEGRRVPLHRAAPHVPPALAAAVEALLANDPERRPQTAALVVEAMAPFAARSRRELAGLVQEHRNAAPKRRAVVSVDATTLDLRSPELEPRAAAPRSVAVVAPAPQTRGGRAAARTGGQAPPPAAHGSRPETRAAQGPVTSSGRAKVALPSLPPRWKRYALSPGAWTSAERAAAQRRAEGRPLHRSLAPDGDEDPPALPRSPVVWVAVAAGVLTCAALASCVLWALP